MGRRFGVVTVLMVLVAAVMAPALAADLVWARSFGGTDFDQGFGVAVDTEGNVYTTGWFSGTADFDPGPGVFELESTGDADVFVSKLDAAGNLVWARSFGGTGTATGFSDGVAVDAAGNVYTTGNFSGTVDFDPGPGTVNLVSNGDGDVFVSKLDAAGNLVWARSFGGTGNDTGFGVAVDANGNVYTTGDFDGTVDFDPGPGTANLTSTGSVDVFVSKLDANGNLVWARSFGGTNDDRGFGIAVDADGNVYTTGEFDGTVDFDPGPGTVNLISNGREDVFVSKLDANGNLVWARSFGGTNDDRGFGIAVDADGGVHTTGRFLGTADFDPGTGEANLTSNGDFDVFVSKLDGDGNLVWARSFGGTGFDDGLGIAVDADGNVYTTGFFLGTADFDPGPGEANLTSNGSVDVFVSKLDAAGNLVWARSFGGTGADPGLGIAVDAASNVYTTGWFSGTVDFDPGPGTVNLISNGSDDVFVVKLDAEARVIRLAGANRFATAAAVSAHHHPFGAGTVFVATGTNFPDALAGAAAAGAINTPLLLLGSIPVATADELDRLDPADIVILGGEAVISAADETALGAWGTTLRLAGANRYLTAIEISQHSFPTAGSADVVVVATGTNFPDALAAAAAAVTLGGPVLLTPPDTLPAAVADEIGRLDPDEILVIGGTAAISAGVFDALDAIKPATRISGADRYHTAVAISEHAFPNPATVSRVYIAVGTNFPDALSGAAAAAAHAAPVLLTPTDGLPFEVIVEITRLAPTRIYILGGEAVVSANVSNQLQALLGL